ISNALLVAVKLAPLASSVYPVPALSILQPANDATPAVRVSGFVVHDSAAPPVPVPDVIDSVITELLVLVTLLPPASSDATSSRVGSATPPVERAGSWVNTRCVPAPTVMSNKLLVAPVKPLADAVSVYPVPALSITQPANVATPDDAASGSVVHDNVPPPG